MRYIRGDYRMNSLQRKVCVFLVQESKSRGEFIKSQ